VEVRSLLFELHRASLAEQGLATALERLAAAVRIRGDVSVTCDATSRTRLAPETELALFRIAQEGLANVIKHAHATEATIVLAEGSGEVVLTVSDNGVGFDPSAPPASAVGGAHGGMGLHSMQERADAAGLTLAIRAVPGAGTTIRAATRHHDDQFTTEAQRHRDG
jgi:signal transduction histidine kinase